MSEQNEQRATETTTEQQGEGQTPATQESDEKQVPYSRFKGLQSQASQMKAELESYRKAEADRAEKARIDSEKKAIEAQEFEKVLKAREEEIAKYKAEVESVKAKERRARVEKTLIQSGATNPLIIEGLIAKLHSDAVEDDALDDWIASQKAAFPDSFRGAHAPAMAAHVGNAASAASGSQPAMSFKNAEEVRAFYAQKLKQQR